MARQRNENRKSEILRLHAEGLNNCQIGERLYISRERVRQILKKAGKRSVRVYRKTWSDSELRDIASRFLQADRESDILQEVGGDMKRLKKQLTRLDSDFPIKLKAAKRERAARRRLKRLDAKKEYWVGQNFGLLSVNDLYYSDGPPYILRAKLTCQCGKETDHSMASIRQGRALGCGGKGCNTQARRNRIEYMGQLNRLMDDEP